VKTANNVTEDINRKVKRSLFRGKRRVVRYGLLVCNLFLVAGIVGFIISTRNAAPASSTPILSLTEEKAVVSPLDELSGADIAVNVAQLVRMDQTTAVINNADSVKAQLDVVPSSTQVVSKPQIVETELKSKKDIKTYTTAAGDTVDSLAEKFGVAADSIKWSNGLTSAKVEANKEIVIPPVNGLVYTVQSGDTPETLASKYRSDKDRIIAYNDAEIGGLVIGEKILIPDGKKPDPPRAYISVSYGSSAVYGFNGYDYGCIVHSS
jgi:LysM repeat protein